MDGKTAATNALVRQFRFSPNGKHKRPPHYISKDLRYAIRSIYEKPLLLCAVTEVKNRFAGSESAFLWYLRSCARVLPDYGNAPKVRRP